MPDLNMALAEAVKLNQHIAQFLKFSTYPEYNDLSGLDIDFDDGEQSQTLLVSVALLNGSKEMISFS